MPDIMLLNSSNCRPERATGKLDLSQQGPVDPVLQDLVIELAKKEQPISAEQPIEQAAPSQEQAVVSPPADKPTQATTEAVQPPSSEGVRTYVRDDGAEVSGEVVSEDENYVEVRTDENTTRRLNKKFYQEQQDGEAPASVEAVGDKAEPQKEVAGSTPASVKSTAELELELLERVSKDRPLNKDEQRELNALREQVSTTPPAEPGIDRQESKEAAPKQEGEVSPEEQTAKDLGIEFNGYQETGDPNVRFALYTDEVTGGTFAQDEGETVKQALIRQRKAFGFDESGVKLDKKPATSEQVKGGKPQDIEALAKERQAGGYVSVPDRKGVSRVVQQVGRALKRNFTRMQGMDADTYKATLERKHSQESAIVMGWVYRSAFKAARKPLIAKHGKEAVQKAMQDVVYGDMTIDEFVTQFGVPRNHIMVKALSKFHEARKANSERIADLLEEQGANPELVEKIRDNDFYVSRFYMKHMMGEHFQPEQADYDAATREISAGIEEAVEGLAATASELRGKTKKTFADPVKFMQTRNPALIENLSPSRQEKMRVLANKFDKLNQVIESVMYDENGNVVVSVNSDALLDAAQSTVDFYLNRTETGAGSVDVSHLKKRFLQGAFRSLYQEVTDPLFSAPSTIEAQEQLIANLLMFNTLVAKGEGKSWSDMPSRKLGTEIQLGKFDNKADRMRYGKLAGKFVTKELHDAIIGAKPPPKALQYVWHKPIGVMRGLKLLGPKTIGRNYTEAYIGFAMGSGDAFRKGYGRNYAKASRLAADILRGKSSAKEELASLIKKGVFSLRGSTQAEEVLNMLSTSPGVKAKNWFQKTMEAYSMIDFPSKVASYYTALDRGMSEAEAVEHVRKFYQNPDSIPKISAKVSKLGVTDYIGYRIDAIRIRANQVKHAVEQAKKGDMVPMTGLTVSASIDMARRGALTALWGNAAIQAWAQIQKAFMDDDDEMEKAELVDKTREIALREFMPPWYQDAPIVVWQETMKDGTTKMYYSAIGGNSAFPLEDLLYGAYMAEEDKADVPARVVQNLFTENMRGSMYLQSIYKAFTGDSMPNIPELVASLAKGEPPSGTFQSKGILDVINGSDIKKNEIIRESIFNLGLDVYGGQIGPKIQQTRAVRRRMAGDLEPRAGTYTPYRSVQETWMALFNPTRTYAIDKNEATRLVRNSLLSYRDGLQSSKGAVSERDKTVKNLGEATEYLNEWADRGQSERYKLLQRAEGIVATAQQAFGDMISDKEYAAILRDGMGMSVDEAKAVMRGKVDSLKEYRPKLRKTALERSGDTSAPKKPIQPKKPRKAKPAPVDS